MIENQGPRIAGTHAVLVSLRGRGSFPTEPRLGKHWNAFPYGAPGSLLVLEVKAIYCLDETT